ncbi:MAG: hypothetical protein ABI443_09910 [Chthoniobacterales bacterium]
MSNKHIACLVILFFAVLIIQGVIMIRTRATEMRGNAEIARRSVMEAKANINNQRAALDNLKLKSAALLGYLDAWEPYLAAVSTPESGELYINTLIKKNNLLLLSQRFDVMPNKLELPTASASTPKSTKAVTIPQMVRANLIIEDDFIKTINWLGQIETDLPTARVSNLDLIRGQSGNDLKMNLIFDVPLAKPAITPSPDK